MPPDPIRQHPPTHDALHPLVYRSIIGLMILLLLSIWVFFDHGTYVGLTLAVITVFFIIVAAIPLLIWKTWQHNAPPADTKPEDESFGAWKEDEFATWSGKLTGSEAAIQTLLPIAAVSIGMFVFGLVYYFDIPHVGGY